MQDIVLTVCGLFLGYALIPQVVRGFKYKIGVMDVQTAVITTTALFIMSITFATLGLWFTSIGNSVTTSLWFLLLVQRIIYRNPEKENET